MSREDPRWPEDVGEGLLALEEELGVTTGRMFGHPALYANGRLCACAYGDGLGLKLPRPRVAELVDAGEATPFQPYGKAPMSEWAHVRAVRREDVDRLVPLVVESVSFVADLPRK